MAFTVHAVMPGVWHIVDCMGVCMTLLEGENAAMLVDTGYGIEDVADFMHHMTDLPLTVFLTHNHHDHAMGARCFPETYMLEADMADWRMFTNDEMRRRVDDSMKMAGIYEYRERAPHNLSGGQKQRVAIAGVVAMRPDCLILDEATAMLDPRGREQVMQTIHYLNRNMGITVVSITHYMEEAAQADRVLVMSKGHVVMEGTPKEVFSQTEKVRSLHLDVPQAAELRDELVKAGIPMPEGIIDTGECAQALYELLQ